MFNFLNNIKKTIFCNKEDYLIFIAILCLIFVCAKLAIYFSEFRLKAEFDKLPPLSMKTKVILKGVHVGEIEKIRLTKDVKHTILELKLYKKYHLPIGTVAKLKSHFLEKNYIDLSLPEKDTKIRIKQHQTIPGIIALDARALLDKHLEDGSLDNMIKSVKGAMSSANNTSKNLEEGTELIVQILSENRQEISNAIKNFSRTSKNIENFTKNLNLILEDQKVNNQVKSILTSTADSMENIKNLTADVEFKQSAQNIKESTESFKNVMKNFESASKNIECTTEKLNNSMGTTLSKTHCLLEEGVDTVRSVKHLSNGMSKTVSKNFLFWRFMFGKPGKALEHPPEPCAACPYK